MNIGQIANEIIRANPGKSNAELLKLVLEHPNYPKDTGGTKEASIAWYKSKMNTNAHKSAAIQSVIKERTIDIIKAEIEEAKAKVAMLEEELQLKIEAEEAKEEEELARLLEKKRLRDEAKKQVEGTN